MTRPEDVKAAVDAGADAVGFVFFSKSRRGISPQQGRALREAVPAFVDVVALFVNPDPEYVQEVIEKVAPDLLQFHGTESPTDCERYGRRYIRAFRVGGPGMETSEDVLTRCRRYDSASAWLFDSYSDGFGGSGEGFDLSLLSGVIKASDARPIVLAGGLNAQNVASNIRRLRPFAVDVSSGIEEGPGIKSADQMEAFLEAVRDSDLAMA